MPDPTLLDAILQRILPQFNKGGMDQSVRRQMMSAPQQQISAPPMPQPPPSPMPDLPQQASAVPPPMSASIPPPPPSLGLGNPFGQPPQGPMPPQPDQGPMQSPPPDLSGGPSPTAFESLGDVSGLQDQVPSLSSGMSSPIGQLMQAASQNQMPPPTHHSRVGGFFRHLLG